jgi:redox-sensitive bicupin YhaK (pirin superfamily)
MTPGIQTPQLPHGLVCRRASERFHSRNGWLDSWHTFSFGGHHDPQWMGFGPLRVINDDTIAAGQGFGMHPHREGEVQRMSAGTGIVHSEINQGAGPCRLLQIWIEPSLTGLTPAYEQKPFVVTGDWTPLLDPRGEGGAMAINRPVRLWRVRPAIGVPLPLPLESAHRTAPHPAPLLWMQLIAGRAQLDLAGRSAPLTLAEGDGVGLLAGEATLTSRAEGTDVLLFAMA